MAYSENTALCAFVQLRSDLIRDGFLTPNTYGKEFCSPKAISAVYVFLLVRNEDFQSALVAYVGMSKNLKQRWQAHPVLREIETPGFWTMKWFKPVKTEVLISTEKKYISQFNPPWNITGRTRGVTLE